MLLLSVSKMESPEFIYNQVKLFFFLMLSNKLGLLLVVVCAARAVGVYQKTGDSYKSFLIVDLLGFVFGESFVVFISNFPERNV